MSINAEKLSEILSVYQRISAYTLGGPAVVHGFMMAPSSNGNVNSSAYTLPSSAPNKCTASNGQLVPVQSATRTKVTANLNSTGNNNEQQLRSATVPSVDARQTMVSRCDSISSTSVDLDENEVEMMLFEGDMIPAFSVGGERRLYMPMLLRRLLQRGFNDRAIHAACEELKIHFQEASNDQMDALRRTLQADVPRCGLIKRSDAERLWAILDETSATIEEKSTDSTPGSQNSDSAACSSNGNSRIPSGSSSPTTSPSDRLHELPTANSFRVYHACFGKQKGIFVPEWYTAPDARCVVCTRCGAQCSPERFVTHVHRAKAENNVAHWGFDPAKWRAYLLLSKDQHASKELRDYYESLKCKFDASRKRKICSVAPSQSVQQATACTTPSLDTATASTKKSRLETDVAEQVSACAVRPAISDFRQVPTNVTLPAGSVTIAQAALASARASTTNSTTSTTTISSDSVANSTSIFASAMPDSTASAVCMRELHTLQEAQEREMKTLRNLVDGHAFPAADANDFLSETAALRRRQFALLSSVMYENVLLNQQLKASRESSEKILAAFATENSTLRGERRKLEDELARLSAHLAMTAVKPAPTQEGSLVATEIEQSGAESHLLVQKNEIKLEKHMETNVQTKSDRSIVSMVDGDATRCSADVDSPRTLKSDDSQVPPPGINELESDA